MGKSSPRSRVPESQTPALCVINLHFKLLETANVPRYICTLGVSPSWVLFHQGGSLLEPKGRCWAEMIPKPPAEGGLQQKPWRPGRKEGKKFLPSRGKVFFKGGKSCRPRKAASSPSCGEGGRRKRNPESRQPSKRIHFRRNFVLTFNA